MMDPALPSVTAARNAADRYPGRHTCSPPHRPSDASIPVRCVRRNAWESLWLGSTWVIALHPDDVGNTHPSGQERVLAVGLMPATPARVAEDVDVRSPEIEPSERTRYSPVGLHCPRMENTAFCTDVNGHLLDCSRANVAASPTGSGNSVTPSRDTPCNASLHQSHEGIPNLGTTRDWLTSWLAFSSRVKRFTRSPARSAGDCAALVETGCCAGRTEALNPPMQINFCLWFECKMASIGTNLGFDKKAIRTTACLSRFFDVIPCEPPFRSPRNVFVAFSGRGH